MSAVFVRLLPRGTTAVRYSQGGPMRFVAACPGLAGAARRAQTMPISTLVAIQHERGPTLGVLRGLTSGGTQRPAHAGGTLSVAFATTTRVARPPDFLNPPLDWGWNAFWPLAALLANAMAPDPQLRSGALPGLSATASLRETNVSIMGDTFEKRGR